MLSVKFPYPFSEEIPNFATEEEFFSSLYMHLSEVDALSTAVNWTKYFLHTVPSTHHTYILKDPVVIANKAAIQS
ncbi:hypothetical protein ANCCAN_20156 [Ancylostoma caninum]|uniref:Uncharacterized protein n=1 Tax=Ancylostoma caninum TaxID=29170 RepID=A0A368FR89_ANCCA|nr:hypothetical protein ANCCAN_20156 [Ancylostoma caninum]